MKIGRKISIVISLFMGAVMGAVFTLMSMLKTGNVIPIGIVVSALISMALSIIIGFIIPMKEVSEGLARLFRINPARQKFIYNLLEAVVGDLIFTPFLCTFFIIKNVGIHNPVFGKALVSSLIIDFILGIPICFIFCPLFKKLAAKIFHVSGIN